MACRRPKHKTEPLTAINPIMLRPKGATSPALGHLRIKMATNGVMQLRSLLLRLLWRLLWATCSQLFPFLLTAPMCRCATCARMKGPQILPRPRPAPPTQSQEDSKIFQPKPKKIPETMNPIRFKTHAASFGLWCSQRPSLELPCAPSARRRRRGAKPPWGRS